MIVLYLLFLFCEFWAGLVDPSISLGHHGLIIAMEPTGLMFLALALVVGSDFPKMPRFKRQ